MALNIVTKTFRVSGRRRLFAWKATTEEYGDRFEGVGPTKQDAIYWLKIRLLFSDLPMDGLCF